jgi:hypothetical protein
MICNDQYIQKGPYELRRNLMWIKCGGYLYNLFYLVVYKNAVLVERDLKKN